MNIDGSCRENSESSGGGGVIQDSHGSFIATFSQKFDFGTNNSAELQALICGIQMCKNMGYQNICIKFD